MGEGRGRVIPNLKAADVRVLSRRRLTGQRTARPQTCHVTPKPNGLHAAILAHVSSHPDATIAELRAWLLETHKVSASTGLMNKTLTALDLTFKKRARIGGPPVAVETDLAIVGLEGSGRKLFGGSVPVKKRGPWAVADLQVVRFRQISRQRTLFRWKRRWV